MQNKNEISTILGQGAPSFQKQKYDQKVLYLCRRTRC